MLAVLDTARLICPGSERVQGTDAICLSNEATTLGFGAAFLEEAPLLLHFV